MISASIVCFNESEKLEKCLRSLSDFADEIVMVDLGSSDESREIAKNFGAVVLRHQFVPYVEMVRNFAISKTSGEWVLILDPDEILISNLRDKLEEVVKEDKFAAVNIPRRNIFFGKWIKHTNWWPDRHVRFFKKGTVSWSDKIHVYPKVTGSVFNLPAQENFAIIHHGYDSISQFMDRQNRYSEIEAESLYRSGEKFSWTNFFWKPTREFLVRFIRHRGFLDGFYGFTLTILMMVYQLEVMIKLWEIEKDSKR